jgi:hypothetical protein
LCLTLGELLCIVRRRVSPLEIQIHQPVSNQSKIGNHSTVAPDTNLRVIGWLTCLLSIVPLISFTIGHVRAGEADIPSTFQEPSLG